MDDKIRDLEVQTYCCPACGRQFQYQEAHCYSRYCPNCGELMIYTEEIGVQDKELLVIGGYF